MAKNKMDLDGLVDDQAAGDNPDEELERLKKERAGQDRKVSQLLEENKRLKEMADGGESVDRLAIIQEKAGQLSELERQYREKVEALNWAIENKVAIPMAIGNAGRLDEFKNEIGELRETLYKGVMTGLRQNKDFLGGRGKAADVSNAITVEHLGRMSGSELHRIPSRILDRLREGK